MKSHSVLFDFAKYVSLSLISTVASSLYILADTFFIANSVGSDGLTAINLVLPIVNFMFAIGIMFGIGASTKFTIVINTGNTRKGSEIFTSSFTISGGIGLIFFILGQLFAKNFSALLGCDADILPIATTYLKILMSFAPFFILNLLMSSFVRNDKNPNLSMIAMVASSLSNIVLDYILMYPCNLGIFGAAIATGFSPIVSLSILSIHVLQKKNTFKFVKSKLKASEIFNFLSLGFSPFINEISSGIVVLLFNFVILGISSNLGVAAYGIIANIAFVCIYIFTGIGQGLQPVVSKSYASDNHTEIRKICTAAIVTAISTAILCFLVVTILREPIVSAFNENGDPELQSIAVRGIPLYFASILLAGINITLSAFFSAVEKPANATIISILRGGLAIIPVLLVLPRFLGMDGVWLSSPAAELITSAVTLILFITYIIRLNKTIKSKNNA